MSLQAGVVDYLVKPLGRDAVLKAVRLGLEWKQMSIAVQAKKNDRTDSIEKWLGTPPKTGST